MTAIETNAGSRCPVCASSRTFALAEASSVPILMNRLYPTAAAARAAPSGTVRLTRCGECGFTWNRDFRPELIVYDEDYENDQTCSGVFQAHVERLASDVVRAAEPLHYLEIGCGQGSFIGLVANRAGSRLASAEGFDPAWRGAEGEGPFGARIHKSYFTHTSLAALEHEPNVVVSRHTIEHVPDPIAFLSAIRDSLGPTNATIFVETPCIDWILRHDALQDFFYEHCSLFTARALALALVRSGFHSPAVEHVFGGQYLWARARAADAAPALATPEPLHIDETTARRDAFVSRWRRRAEEAALRGRCAIWGAGAKGVTFALMLDANAQPFDHVVDINPAKQGLHLAGSGLAVLSPEQSVARGVSTYFVMNPNYREEVAARLAALVSNAELIALDGDVEK
jgi:hypothetical protein